MSHDRPQQVRNSHSLYPTLPLASPFVDRDAERRARPELFDELLADPATRVLPLAGSRALMSDSEGRALALRAPDDVSAGLVRVYLGTTVDATESEPAGTPVIATVLTDAAAGELEPDRSKWASLRSTAMTLSKRDAGLFSEAVAVANWHVSHTHCPRCGTPTVVEQGGWMRRCFVDDNEIFPRTDPAVIAAVIDEDDRILLGSNALWEENRFSLLAGFVEAGESFEAAVLREIHEEAGIRVADPEYVGSQPWPFPASVMIGFRCRLAAGQSADDLRPDGEEILALRWFTREQMWREHDELMMPGSASIARAIVEDWYGGSLDEPPHHT